MATKKTATTDTNVSEVVLEQLKLKTIKITLVGDSPLICHAWSQKAKEMMLHKMLKKASVGREERRPTIDFVESLYWLSDKPNLNSLTEEKASERLAEIIPKSIFGFPTVAFKSAALDAGFQQGVLAAKAGTAALAKTTARGAIHIADDFAVIHGIPMPREDMVRVGQGADLRYRAEFKTWSTDLVITFNESAISEEQVLNLFRLGGFANGVGDWRPAKGGSFGRFHVQGK